MVCAIYDSAGSVLSWRSQPRKSQGTYRGRQSEDWFQFGAKQDIELRELDVILMQKDPPFDLDYIYTTYLLEQAHRSGTLVVNNPQSLRDCNEKMFATQFPQCCPALLVSADPERLKAFHVEHEDVIYKPLDGMGGSSIFRAKPEDANLSVIIETLTQHGRRQIMAQRFLPDIVNGDKRILMIDGVPVPYALARIPAIGESRGNLAAGGNGVALYPIGISGFASRSQARSKRKSCCSSVWT